MRQPNMDYLSHGRSSASKRSKSIGNAPYDHDTREPCALKGACTVRRGAVGKGLAEIPLEGIPVKQIKAGNSTSLAAYSTRHMPEKSIQEIKLFYCYARKDKDLRDELEVR